MQSRNKFSIERKWPVFAVGLAVMAVPLAAQPERLSMLSGLATGEWTIKFRDGSPDRKICVKTGKELIQIQHDQRDCNRFVIDDEAVKVTVQYTCPGNGYGRTNIRRETNELVQITSQGIDSGTHFRFAAEARRTGSC